MLVLIVWITGADWSLMAARDVRKPRIELTVPCGTLTLPFSAPFLR